MNVKNYPRKHYHLHYGKRPVYQCPKCHCTYAGSKHGSVTGGFTGSLGTAF